MLAYDQHCWCLRPMRRHTCWSIPSAVQWRAEPKITCGNVGLRNKLCQLSSCTRQTNQSRDIGQQPKGEKSPLAARQHATKTSCLSKTYAGNQPRGCPPTCPRQACPPHFPEESYKRWASTHYDSIQFCNGCSVRDTCPQKLTELYSIKIHSVRPQSFISSTKGKG